MKGHCYLLVLLFLLLSMCKVFLERVVLLRTSLIHKKNDSTLILTAHLVDYNPKIPIKEVGFIIAKDDSSQLYTSPRKIYTREPNSLRRGLITLQYTDTSLVYKNPNLATLKPIKVFAQSYVQLKNNEIIRSNDIQVIELNWGNFENITSTTTSISFDYVINLDRDCITAVISNMGIEYGFYYHTQPTPSENNHLGKITKYLDDGLIMACTLGYARFVENVTINGLQPRTTYYVRYYLKIGNEIRYGQVFSVTTK
ncbi:MAG: fibronectin type III domain-containing protein [Microscillaceae bacterium]|nr:fibronectin type III domain-containing protein [Microscillaceae bacterium]MDW8460751.1 fibronectin type III domain-containing protein [Cytophagales bacterium]